MVQYYKVILLHRHCEISQVLVLCRYLSSLWRENLSLVDISLNVGHDLQSFSFPCCVIDAVFADCKNYVEKHLEDKVLSFSQHPFVSLFLWDWHKILYQKNLSKYNDGSECPVLLWLW